MVYDILLTMFTRRIYENVASGCSVGVVLVSATMCTIRFSEALMCLFHMLTYIYERMFVSVCAIVFI